jgi:hypothetical protein
MSIHLFNLFVRIVCFLYHFKINRPNFVLVSERLEKGNEFE